MRVHKRLFLMGATALAALSGAIAPMAASAQAADVLVLQGASARANVCWVADNCTGEGLLQPYGFNGSNCTVISSDVELTGCNTNSAGHFVNVVCGTGAVLGSPVSDSQATVTETDGDTEQLTSVNVVFVATVGVLASTTSPTGGAAGVVQLLATPNIPPSANGLCTPSFSVTIVAVSANA